MISADLPAFGVLLLLICTLVASTPSVEVYRPPCHDHESCGVAGTGQFCTAESECSPCADGEGPICDETEDALSFDRPVDGSCSICRLDWMPGLHRRQAARSDPADQEAESLESGRDAFGGCWLSTLCLDSLDNSAAGILAEVLLFGYSFLGLAIVCDNHLVVALETLCLRWSLREDVAGATFMAFGSAAPEIIINTIATIRSAGVGDEAARSTSLGISAIIGSGRARVYF